MYKKNSTQTNNFEFWINVVSLHPKKNTRKSINIKTKEK